MGAERPPGPGPEERLLGAIFGGPPLPAPSRLARERQEDEALRQHIADVFERLPRLERRVLARRFGLSGSPRGASIAEISLEMGLTPTQVREAIVRGLRRVQRLEHDNDHP